MIRKVLIANRGEIALRIMRAAKSLNMQTVAVYSSADKDLLHVRLCDEAVCIGPSDPQKSYLNIPAILSAAETTNACAIHPGYGFLSENAGFAEQTKKSGFIFAGPDATTIRTMSNKIQAIKTMQSFGVPTVPGSNGPLPKEPNQQKAIAREIGYPILVKASAGGGGRGMRIVHHEKDLLQAVQDAQKEALAVFLNDEVYAEKFLTKPRHIEVQVLADQFGHVLCLGDRDCSVQRRQQKVIEEAQAYGLTDAERQKLFDICIHACEQIGYEGAGTLEFLYEEGNFYFIEMNTRVQVEHPVSEMITGVDIVREQLKAHSGEAFQLRQQDITFRGHAIECRINAEDPVTMLPTPGTVQVFHPPLGPGVRVDSHLYTGYKIPHFYDSLIAKIITYGETRERAIQLMRHALEETVIDGVKTNIPLHLRILQDPTFCQGHANIHYLNHFLATH
jgi:acetyl-CoA carboxylase biotin carboxylase subunit